MATVFLHFSVPSREVLLEPPSEWAAQIRAGVQQLAAAPIPTREDGGTDSGLPFRDERLFVLFSLPDSLMSSSTLKLSFDEVAHFCQWSYAQAWGEAVRLDHLLLNVNVLLVPGSDGIYDIIKAESDPDSKGSRNVMLVGEYLSSLPMDSKPTSPPNLTNAPTSTPTTPTSSSNLPQHSVVALGGTFDHLHAGHKILLSSACALASRKLIIGITSDSMLRSKAEPALLESIEIRKERVREFCELFVRALRPGATTATGEKGALELEIVTLEDVAGPAGSEADLQALVLTEETLAGGKAIAEIREGRGLGSLREYVIGVLGAKGETDLGGVGRDAKELAAAKVGSTAIRKWLAAQRRGGE
ncbi:unnamed protein product [Tilletia controversa]|uniref:Cytidyltransferase-like domain-containing protein n=1 Tax=Tilletia controversa TaxID=13291 RepID=A0A8X7SUI9_9BASI|nr:hypothetical protein CF328_g6122 [Tilletia controversa]KAE8242419.1 hypothetical protein A4X06_0g6925 [Tilletia controversa]CAD6921236.1 unnamed protein product [Tilletia controversa]CAD6932009.1 unnamed protein product [Tilletia controversa]CAD6985111.1 unnamed protein product [Tilletia controversa]